MDDQLTITRPDSVRVIQIGRNDPVSAEESAANVEAFKARAAPPPQHSSAEPNPAKPLA